MASAMEPGVRLYHLGHDPGICQQGAYERGVGTGWFQGDRAGYMPP